MFTNSITSRVLCPLILTGAVLACGSISRYEEENIEGLSLCLEMFREETGRYPPQDKGLCALVCAGYLQRLPTDSWGRPYVYVFPGQKNPEKFDLYSRGEDGISMSQGDDPDDINNWNTDKPWRRYYALRQKGITWTTVLLISVGLLCVVIVFSLYLLFRKKTRRE